MANTTRPRRKIVHRNLEYNGGLLHEEELALRRALQASIVSSKKPSSADTDKDSNSSHQKSNIKRHRSSTKPSSTQTEIKSSMKIKKKRKTTEEELSPKRRKRKPSSSTESRSSSPNLASSFEKVCTFSSGKKQHNSEIYKVANDVDAIRKEHINGLDSKKLQKKLKKHKGSQDNALLRKSFKVRRKNMRRMNSKSNVGFSGSDSGSESTASSSSARESTNRKRLQGPLWNSHMFAQRKFAAVHPVGSSRTDNQESEDSTLAVRGKTEDFLTFLCLRGDQSMPKELEVFNCPSGIPSSLSDDEIISITSSPSPSETSSVMPHTSVDSPCETLTLDSLSQDSSDAAAHAIRMFAGITHLSDANDKAAVNAVEFVEPDSEEEPVKFPMSITPPLPSKVSSHPSAPLYGPPGQDMPCLSACPMSHTNTGPDVSRPPPLLCPVSADNAQSCYSPPPLLYIPAAAQRITHLHGPPTLEKVTLTRNHVEVIQRIPDSPPVLTKQISSVCTSSSNCTAEQSAIPLTAHVLTSSDQISPSDKKITNQSMNDSSFSKELVKKSSCMSGSTKGKDIPVIDLSEDDSPAQDSYKKVRTYIDTASCPLHSQTGHGTLNKIPRLAKPMPQRPSIDCPLQTSRTAIGKFHPVSPREIPVINLCDSSFYNPSKSSTQENHHIPRLQYDGKPNCNNNNNLESCSVLCDGQQETISMWKPQSAVNNRIPQSSSVSSDLQTSSLYRLRSASCNETDSHAIEAARPSQDKGIHHVGPVRWDKSSASALPRPYLQISCTIPRTPPYPLSVSTVTSSTGFPSNYQQPGSTNQPRDVQQVVAPGFSDNCASGYPRNLINYTGSDSYWLPRDLNCSKSRLVGKESRTSNISRENRKDCSSKCVEDGIKNEAKTSPNKDEVTKSKSPNKDDGSKNEAKKSPNKNPSSTSTKKDQCDKVNKKTTNCNKSSPRSKSCASKKKPSSKLQEKLVAKPADSPILRPTEEEFKDPVSYLRSVEPSLHKFGICIVEPPESWKPESQLPDNLRFNTQTQLLHRLKQRWGPAEIKLTCIEKHLQQQQSPFNLSQIPQIGGLEVDLPRISRVMAEFGGMQKVIDYNKWPKVADALRIPKTAQDRIGKLQDIYCKYLLSYDLLPEDEKQRLEEQVETECLQDANHSSGTGDKDTECVKKGKYHSIVSFQRVARNMQEHIFKTPPTAADVEREYWNIIQSRDRYVSVSRAKVEGHEEGSCFPVGKNNPYARSGWNLNVLPRLKGSALKHVGNIEGLSVPWLHVDMVFSTDRWSVNPLQMYTLTYLHTPADKVWYGVPEGYVAKFPNSLLDDSNGTNNRDTMVSPPNLLKETGVTVTRLVQKQGQFVVASPKAYHCNISCGYSLSESVAFAFPDWLLRVPNLPKNALTQWPSFPFDKMVVALADEATNESDVVLRCLHGEMLKIREREASHRKDLQQFGITTEQKPKPPSKGSKNKTYGLRIDGCDLYCEECETLCSLSAVVSEEEPLTLCLPHATEFLKKGNPSSDRSLLCCYTLSQMDEIITTIKEKLQQSEDSK